MGIRIAGSIGKEGVKNISELTLFLVVYVDDFKLAGPKANLAKGWKLIRTPQRWIDRAHAR
eukprot:6192974-Prorocentrum_lima.AAC.1